MAKKHVHDIAQALRSIKGSDLLAELSKVAKIPEVGTLAGQAVASLVMRRLGLGMGSPINDVDVFLSAKLSPRGAEMLNLANKKAEKNARLSSLASHLTRVGVSAENGYSGMYQATIKAGYRINATAREGMLNEVAYERVWADAIDSEALAVLKGFDLNCVQAGIDAASGNLVWTPEFEDFVATSELRVVNVNTPFHTAVRYFKKKKELGCFGDDELNMAMCALPSARGVFLNPMLGISKEASVAGRYGVKVHDDYQALGSEVSVWFKEVKAMDKANIWTMEPVFSEHPELLARLEKAAWQNSAEGVWRGEVASFMFANARGFCESVMRPEAKASTERSARLQSQLKSLGAANKVLGVVSALSQVKGAVYTENADLSERAARAMSKVISAHEDLFEPMSTLTLKEQGAAAIMLRAQEKEHGAKVYGWLEARLNGRDSEAKSRAVEALLTNPEAFNVFCNEQKLEGDRMLAPALNLPAMSGLAVSVAKSMLKVSFHELLTPNALTAEGREMRHCVGGYSYAIESGRSRIFRVEGPAASDRSTLELGLAWGSKNPSSEPQASALQHRSFANKDAEPAANLAANMVVGAYKKTRDDQLLGVAEALAGALDQGAVALSKMKSAKVLLGAALADSRLDEVKFAKLKIKLEQSLTRHFSQGLPESLAEIPPQLSNDKPDGRHAPRFGF